MLCLDKSECKALYKDAKVIELLATMDELDYTFPDLLEDMEKMKQVANTISDRISTNKEEIEIFASVFCYLKFYPEGSRVCFVMKDSVNPSSISVTSLDELIGITREYTVTDFGIFSDDGLRQFQLKQFKETLDTNTLFKFLDKKLKKYGYDLGATNLLVVIQSPEGDIGNVSFDELSIRLKKLPIKSKSDVLISYNENNETLVINTVHPTLGTTKISIKSS